MMGMIFGFLGGPLLNNLLGAYKARLENASGQDKMAVELAIKEIEAEIEARRNANAIIIAEQGRWWTAAPRAIVQWSFALFVAKVVVWDKVLGWGSTDPLNGDVASWAGMLMAMWFGGRTIEKVAQIFRR
ncbi:MAG TPA: hypothetical protein VK148_30545 [Xanthobacteraceae bacterium]|nr:hypothetical protein [Xanthobacteraceae bacterium]